MRSLGSALCEHGRRRSQCKHCGGSRTNLSLKTNIIRFLFIKYVFSFLAQAQVSASTRSSVTFAESAAGRPCANTSECALTARSAVPKGSVSTAARDLSAQPAVVSSCLDRRGMKKTQNNKLHSVLLK